MKLYQYTLLKQDGTKEVLPPCPKKEFRGKGGLYDLLKCSIIEIIPPDYYENQGRCTMYGDEEAAFLETNHHNPHFKVLRDFGGSAWGVVGDIVKEEVYHGE